MRRIVFLFVFVATIIGSLSYALAQNWIVYASPFGIFTTRVPDNFEETAEFFPISDTKAAMVGSGHGDIDQNPYKKAVKNYVVQYTLGIGPKIEDDELPDIIKAELDVYAKHYGSLQGSIETRDNLIFQDGVPGGELKMSYIDPEYGKQSIRLRAFFIQNGKFIQIITGPPQSMHSMTTQAYFETLNLEEGYRQQNEDFKTVSQQVVSPLGIFTAYMPQVMEPYFPKNYSIRKTDSVERLSAQFYDPIRKQYVIYNIYGYLMPDDLNYLRAEGILQENHILRHRFKRGAVEIGRFTNNEIPILKTNYSILPTDEYPYITNVRLRGEFFDNMMVVHEVMASPEMINTRFVDTLIQNVEFHPEKYRDE